jgi:hypothetical protein
MARPPDFVRDSELETQIINNCVIHTYYDSGPAGRRAVPRLEYWQRQCRIGGGAFGSVWLETCAKGQRDIQERAVKEIPIPSRQQSKSVDYNRELEAIAKFSQPKV